MTPPTPQGSARIESVEQLVDGFTHAGKPLADWVVGAEHEQIGVVGDAAAPAPFAGDRGIERLLLSMGEKGWQQVKEGEHVIALAKNGASVTLEPGGQIELSGSPHATLADIDTELAGYQSDLSASSQPLGIRWLSLGFRPFGTLDDVPWMPKARYRIMRSYLAEHGRLAHEMMKRTATVQANLDFSDEADAQLKFRAAMSITSVVTAMFANSPIADGKETDYTSYRARVWLETDEDRCGLLPFAFEDGDLFRRYTEWALDVPMFFVVRDGAYTPAAGTTFRQFLRDGFAGQHATFDDWNLHLSTVFPEVRLKTFIEVRGSDAGPLPMVRAVPALWKGLLYDRDACEQTDALLASLSYADRISLREVVPKQGLLAPVPGHGKVLDVARRVVEIARDGLGRVAPAEISALEVLEEIVATGRVPADLVRDKFRAAGGQPRAFVDSLTS